MPQDYTRALDYFQQAHAAGDAQASVEATGYIDVMNVATGFFGPVDQIRLTAEGRKFIPMMLRKFGDPEEAPGPATSADNLASSTHLASMFLLELCLRPRGQQCRRPRSSSAGQDFQDFRGRVQSTSRPVVNGIAAEARIGRYRRFA